MTLLNELDLSKTLVEEEEDDEFLTYELAKNGKIFKGASDEKRPIKEIDVGGLTDLVVMNAHVVHSAAQERILADARAIVSRLSSFNQVNIGLSELVEGSKEGKR